MKKAERHQMKRDDLVTALERVTLFITDHQKEVLAGAAAILLLVAGAVGLRSWLQGREAEAALHVGQLIRTYDAPIVATMEDLAAAGGAATTFTSADERNRRVVELADEILAHHATAGAAPKALYYKGLALANLDRHEDSLAALQTLIGSYGGDFLAPMARYRIARLREQQGNAGEALVHYQALADGDRGLLPREEGLLGMARCQEALGNTDEALKIYRRILTESPESDYSALVRGRVAELS